MNTPFIVFLFRSSNAFYIIIYYRPVLRSLVCQHGESLLMVNCATHKQFLHTPAQLFLFFTFCHSGMWAPDSKAFIKLLTHEAPAFLGAWCLIAIVAASMSTCDGAILAMGTVFSHNIIRNLSSFFPCFSDTLITNENLLNVARITSIPFTITAALIASFFRSTHSAGATGYLLIVAFDVVLASAVVPLFGAFYTKKPSPLAAFLAIIVGVFVRVVLEFTLPKDGILVAPFGGDEYLDYGSAASVNYPPFFDQPSDYLWDSEAEPCDQARLKDFTGVDSLAAPIVALIVFVLVQFLERNGPLIKFTEKGLMAPYVKESADESESKEVEEEAVKAVAD